MDLEVSKTNSLRTCKFCKQPIDGEMIYGHSIVCRHCHLVEEIPQKTPWGQRLLAPGILLCVSLVAFWLFKSEILMLIDPAYAVIGLSESKVKDLRDQCLKRHDEPCALAAFRRLTEIDPNNSIYQANYAFRLTDIREYAQADKIYEKLLATGTATYDLMAYYGMNLEAMGDVDGAIKWYQKTLEIHPDLVDITRKLAALYVKKGRVLSSISLLRSFARRLPKSEGYVVGDLSANLELVDKVEPETNETVELMGVTHGLFALPLKLKEGTSPLVFLVDTGATNVTIPTTDAQTFFPELMRDAAPGTAILADGRAIKSYRVRVPAIKIGSWEFKDVLIAYCDNCERLVGMSLLRNLKMEISAKGDLLTMKLSR